METKKNTPNGRGAWKTIEMGCAGEHIVCADLLLSGVRAFLSDQGLPYDIVAEVDRRLLRVTVKSTMCPRPRPARINSKDCYQFAVGRRKMIKGGKTVARAYTREHADIVALAALDTRAVAYLSITEAKTTMIFDAPHGRPGTNVFGPKFKTLPSMSDFSFARAVRIFMGRTIAES